MEEFKLTLAQEGALKTLASDATHNALAGGSRSGKTFLLVRSVITRALKAPRSRHAILRFRFNSIKSSVIQDTLPKVMDLCWPGLMAQCEMNRTDWYLTFPNKSEIWFLGLDDKERAEKILGTEFSTLYFNECSQIPYNSVSTAMTRLAQKSSLRLKAYYDLNPPSKQHWTYKLLVERRDPITNQLVRKPDDYSFFQINPADNVENLPESYLETLDALPPKQRERFLLGQFADDSDGALWDPAMLHTTRVLNASDLPQFKRIVISVDPSGCAGEEDIRSDEVGIIVLGLGVDGHAYVLEDLSGRHGPAEWAQIVCDSFERHRADKVIGEDNFGGAMVEHTIRSYNEDIPYEAVKATRGKIVRAEPISSLYHQGKVHHVGQFPELEEQLCGFTTAGYTGLRSPDRADALVWAASAVFPGLTESRQKRDWRPPKKISAPRKSTRYAARYA